MKEVQKDKCLKKRTPRESRKVPIPEIEDWNPNPEYKYPTMDKTMLKSGCDKILDVLANDLLKWSKTDDAISIDGFIKITMLATPRLYEFAEKHEGLKSAISTAKHLMGQRRERFALEGKYNATVVLKTMPLYSAEYKGWVREQNKNVSALGGGTRYVVLDTMPNSYLVPERKEEKEEDGDE